MILITGAGGFIGPHLVRRLLPTHKLRCLVRPGSPHIQKIPPGCEIVEADIRDTLHVQKALQDIDTVIHLAARLRTSSAAEIKDVNIRGTQILVHAAKYAGAKHFIFLSSENAGRLDLCDAYARSKREAETLVRSFPHHLILRPCFVFGPGDGHGLGRLVNTATRGPIVPLFGKLESKIQPIFVDDLVEVLVHAVDKLLQGTFTVAGCDTLSLNDFLKEVCRAKREKKIFVTVPFPLIKLLSLLGKVVGPRFGWGPDQMQNVYHSKTYSIDSAVEAFGYKPRPLREGLNQWFR